MTIATRVSTALAVAAILATSMAPAAPTADVLRPVDPLKRSAVPAKHGARTERPKAAERVQPVVPQVESPAESSAGADFGAVNPFSAAQQSNAIPNTAIAPPVTITYGGAATALSVTDSGTGKGEQYVERAKQTLQSRRPSGRVPSGASGGRGMRG